MFVGTGVRIGVDEGTFVGVGEGEAQTSISPNTFDWAEPLFALQDSAVTEKFTR